MLELLCRIISNHEYFKFSSESIRVWPGTCHSDLLELYLCGIKCESNLKAIMMPQWPGMTRHSRVSGCQWIMIP